MEHYLKQLKVMTRFSNLNEGREEPNFDYSKEDDDGEVVDSGGGIFKVANHIGETHPNYTQEHNVQAMLFGANDYLPFKTSKSLNEAVEQHPYNDKRLVFTHDGEKRTSAADALSVPKHMWEGGKGRGGSKTPGMEEINKKRAAVYGSEPRDPLGIAQIASIHKQTLDDHFSRPMDDQLAIEREARKRLRAAGHLANESMDTTDKGEKTDTVKNEYDEQGRSFIARSAKGVAGHALYTSGTGENERHHIINTCPAQTKGCGGGVDANGLVETTRGTCFAPRSEAQYVNAAIRRAAHEQAKFDPAMTRDWILAHVGSLRMHAGAADKQNKRFLFRPNVLDETDRSSRYAIQHLNRQRAEVGKPPIISNSYGKTEELHDPENNIFVTYSNTGPKVKHGRQISTNIKKDDIRARQTISATQSNGKDLTNEQGNATPAKNSYMVTNMKRDSEMDKAFQKAVTHAKYWTTGREDHQLSKEERAEGPEGHFDGEGKPTTPELAHYGHVTVTGSDGKKRRYDYQKQHVLHPRLVPVSDGKKTHLIPTDSRFKDNEFLPPPAQRFKTKNGKLAGAILITTPTTSTSDELHHTEFTHDVNPGHIKHAEEHGGEYEIDNPFEQEAARGKEYEPPKVKTDMAAVQKKQAKLAAKLRKKAGLTPSSVNPEPIKENFIRRYRGSLNEEDPMFDSKKGEPHKTYYYALAKKVLSRKSGSSSGD